MTDPAARFLFLPRNLAEILIVAGNCVPLAGALALHWSVLQILLFYVAELCVFELAVGAAETGASGAALA